MSFLYLAALLTTLGCMVLIDRRWRVLLWHDAPRTLATVAVGVAFFLAWDLAGIGLGVFFRGSGPWMTGLLVGPELPVEEVVFLTFLCYLTLLLVVGGQRMLAARAARAESAVPPAVAPETPRTAGSPAEEGSAG